MFDPLLIFAIRMVRGEQKKLFSSLHCWTKFTMPRRCLSRMAHFTKLPSWTRQKQNLQFLKAMIVYEYFVLRNPVPIPLISSMGESRHHLYFHYYWRWLASDPSSAVATRNKCHRRDNEYRWICIWWLAFWGEGVEIQLILSSCTEVSILRKIPERKNIWARFETYIVVSISSVEKRALASTFLTSTSKTPCNVFLHLFDLLHLHAWQWHWKFLQWKRKWGGIVKKLSERNHQRIIKFYGQMKNDNMYSLNYITLYSILWKNTTKIYNWLFRWRSHCHWVQ